MKLTITNGNARNGVYGQRLRLTYRNGMEIDWQLPGRAATSKKWRPMIRQAVYECLFAEGELRNFPRSLAASSMLAMFAEGKARLMIDHNRRSIGHA